MSYNLGPLRLGSNDQNRKHQISSGLNNTQVYFLLTQIILGYLHQAVGPKFLPAHHTQIWPLVLWSQTATIAPVNEGKQVTNLKAS